ncbi:MAG: YraN family protein [Paracoccaceae bacterium]
MPFDFSSLEQQRGLVNYHAGLAAETSVELNYAAAGASLLERRWRGKGGEVDLILRDGDELVFVEVKKSKSFARAAESLSHRQLARICRASEEYLGTQPNGSLTPMRIDVALTNEAGEIDILRNVTGF